MFIYHKPEGSIISIHSALSSWVILLILYSPPMVSRFLAFPGGLLTPLRSAVPKKKAERTVLGFSDKFLISPTIYVL